MTSRYKARRCVRQHQTFTTSAWTPVAVATKALGPAYLGAVLLHAEPQTSAWHCLTPEVWVVNADSRGRWLLFIWSRQNQWGRWQRVDSIGTWGLIVWIGQRRICLGYRDGMVGCIFISANRWCEPGCPGVKASSHSQHGEKPSHAVSHPDLGVRHYCF